MHTPGIAAIEIRGFGKGIKEDGGWYKESRDLY
jgi:hypothetical protein